MAKTAGAADRAPRPALYLGNLSFAGVPRAPANYFSESWTSVGYDGPALSGDFNGDGAADIFFYSGAGSTVWTWGKTGFRAISTPAGGGFTPVVVDVNGDGLSDLYFYSPDGPDYLWIATGDDNRWFREADRASTPSAGPGFIPVAGDFNGDGRTDILWYGQGRVGVDWLWIAADVVDRYQGQPLYQGFSGVPTAMGPGLVPFTGDFDGDGKTDVFWHGPGTLPDEIWYMVDGVRALRTASGLVELKTGSVRRVAPVVADITGSYRPVSGDFNGDGRDDIMWDGQGRIANALWLGQQTQGSFVNVPIQSLAVSQTPIVGNFDRLHGEDILWYGAGTLPDALWYSLVP